MTRAGSRVLAPPAFMRRRAAGALGAFAATVALALAALPAAALADAGGAGSPASGEVKPAGALPAAPAAETNVALSNDRDRTTWAHPVEVLPIYVHPNVRSREITRTHIFTEDGFPEVYLLLDSRVDGTGHAWIKLR